MSTDFKRTIVIGDIHGCYQTMLNLLKTVDYNSAEDKLIFLGDYIDRGPSSYDVVSTIMHLQEQVGREKCVCLRGNHEQMAIDCVGRWHPSWVRNGCEYTIVSYQNNGHDVREHLGWFNSLPLVHETGDYIFCHAGLSYPDLCDNDDEDLLWGRDWIVTDSAPREKPVIFGHTPSKTGQPYQALSGDTCIDCGCVYGRNLCAAIIAGGNIEFFTVENSEHPEAHL